MNPLVSPALPDAEAQIMDLAERLRPLIPANGDAALVGIYSGGAWIAERLATLLSITDVGRVDVSFYRDDFAEKGLHPQVKPTSIPFEVSGRTLILVDDVLYTGRTTRAALNEIFDYGRPAAVRLAVLADRGGRELPISPDVCLWQLSLAPGQTLVLTKDANDRLAWSLDHAA